MIFIGNACGEISFPDGDSLLSALRRAGIGTGFCGGRGICGKCRVFITEGDPSLISPPPDSDGSFLLCRARQSGGTVTVRVPGGSSVRFPPSSADTGIFVTQAFGDDRICPGIAFDLGTTTLEAEIPASDGNPSRYLRVPDPLDVYGADVMSLICASSDHLDEMTDLLRGKVNGMIRALCGELIPARAVFAGNTVMTHIFRGISPVSMGTYPYTPAVTGSLTVPGEGLGIRADEITVLPCVSAFIGGDVTAGLLYAGFDRLRSDETALFCDLGTNGELVFAENGKLFAASAAAGPAFEGGGLACGMPFIPGAIYSVTLPEGSESEEDVGIAVLSRSANAETASGICGSGIVGAIDVMLRLGVIQADGGFACEDRDGVFRLTDKVYVTQKDVRAFQLAHGAVRTAAHMLARGASPDRLYLAGNFGSSASIEALTRLGTIPEVPASDSLGNASLKGAEMILADPGVLSGAENIAGSVVSLDLNSDPDFNSIFIRNLSLGTFVRDNDNNNIQRKWRK